MGSQQHISNISFPVSSQPHRGSSADEDAFLRNMEWTSSCSDMELANSAPVAIPLANDNAGPGRAKLERGGAKLERGEADDTDPAECMRLIFRVFLAIVIMSIVTMSLAVMDVPFGSVRRPQYARKGGPWK
ncbi:hypothetical protein MTO96_022175 [Rhipicephalus appendiculatus]